MKLEFSTEEAVKSRYSVRTFADKDITPEIKDKIRAYFDTLSNPFSVKINFKLLEGKKTDNSQKLGTYGMVKGAKDYIGATVSNGEFSLIAYGYEFEKLILYVTSLGLGTCWLGGTFNRSEFARAMDVKEYEIFPAVSPIGYPAEKKRFAETLVRKFVKADQRKPWEQLFFNGNFSVPLSKAEAGVYQFPLEMLRLAPSASNKQPWQIVKQDDSFHFFENKTAGYSDQFDYDIQIIDMGIAACHFHLAALEKDLSGKFIKCQTDIAVIPADTNYMFTWVAK